MYGKPGSNIGGVCQHKHLLLGQFTVRAVFGKVCQSGLILHTVEEIRIAFGSKLEHGNRRSDILT